MCHLLRNIQNRCCSHGYVKIYSVSFQNCWQSCVQVLLCLNCLNDHGIQIKNKKKMTMEWSAIRITVLLIFQTTILLFYKLIQWYVLRLLKCIPSCVCSSVGHFSPPFRLYLRTSRLLVILPSLSLSLHFVHSPTKQSKGTSTK